ncbi:MAG TPA: DUF58 domain-containing protein [Acidimicrobiales bacterium]|nr:DUF58 domain-containing protein [Acidimicrobiales bacterium]
MPGAAVVALVAACGAWAARRPAIDLDRTIEPPRVAKGGDAVLVVRASNRSRRPVRGLVLEQRIGPSVARVELDRLRRRESLVRTYRLPTADRGEFEVGPAELVRADPFGLWRRVQLLGVPQRLVVTPRVVLLRPLPAGRSRLVEGPTSDTAPQGSTTFHRLREYVVGDDLRTVHWPSTARLGTLVVRHSVDTAQPSTVVLVDLRPSVHAADTFEEAVDLAATVVVVAGAGRAPVTFRTTSGVVLRAGAAAGPAAVLDWLTRAAPDGAGSLEEALAVVGRDRGVSNLVVVTGTAEPAALRAAAAAAGRYEAVVVAALTAAALPQVAGVTTLAAPDLDRMVAAWDAAVLHRGAPRWWR